MKQTKQIKVYELGYDDVPQKADEFIKFWQDKINMVPDEFRGTTEIEMEAEESYGCATLEATVIYKRPETDKEEQLREKQAQDRQEAITRRELEELTKLKRKYGDV